MKRYILFIFGSVSSVAGKHITCINYMLWPTIFYLCYQKINIIIYNLNSAGNFKSLQPQQSGLLCYRVTVLQL